VKAVVGVTVCIDSGERFRAGVDYVYLRRDYARALAGVGATPLLLTPEIAPEDAALLCDGVVISGGGDLPRQFDIEPDAPPIAEAERPDRIAWERALLSALEIAAKPVLGVCYGMQLINLHFGGSLLRSVHDEVPGSLDHGGQGGKAEHLVRREGVSRLLERLPVEFRASSSHGQAIDQIAPGFEITARTSDGVIEAMEREQFFGVEWHPETDATEMPVYGKFVEIVNARSAL
jgi:putative glutamine amidotransferase